jgi:SagB-type dehydrogenase family enzyme
MSTVDLPATSEALAAELERSVEAGEMTAAYGRLVSELLDNSAHLRERDDLRLAHLVHASLRSSTTADGAPPEDIPILAAPDLEIERDGRARALPGDPPERAAALHELLRARRSVPYFGRRPMPIATLGSLLSLALGTRELLSAYSRRDIPSRMFPSAGGLQPIDAYVFVNRVEELPSGVYFYNPVRHELVEHELGDFRTRLVEAAIHTDWLLYAPVVVALVGNLRRVGWKYGSRGYRYMNVDTGVVAMNLYLAGQALGLHGNAVAAFDDDAFNALLRLDGSWELTNLLFAAGERPRTMRG